MHWNFIWDCKSRNPADPSARAGLAEVLERLLAAKRRMPLLEERLDEAGRPSIETAAQNPAVEGGRIAFLTAQLAKVARRQVKTAQALIQRQAAPCTQASLKPWRIAR